MTSGSLGTLNLCAPRKATAPFFPSCTGPCHKATPKFALQQFSRPLTAQQKPVAAASLDTAATGKNQALTGPRTHVHHCRSSAAYSRWSRSMPNMRRLSECEAQLLEAAGYVIKRKTGTARILGSHTIPQVHHEEGLLVGALEEFSGNTVEIRAGHGASI